MNREDIAGILALGAYGVLVGMPLLQLTKTDFYSITNVAITLVISAGVAFLMILLLYAIIK